MASGCYRFDRFRLDAANRRLTCDGAPVELNARYLDALILLVRERGGLVSKDRFLEEVWRGVPVTDEALTQGIATIRRRLGDDAARPRFIETAPKHGYRFIAPVTEIGEAPTPEQGAAIASPDRRRDVLWLGGAGTLGGGAAGAVGGLFYALAVSQSAPSAMGGASVLLVLVVLTALIGLIGGAGVGFGIAAASLAPDRLWAWRFIGGALGGLVVGAVVNLIGVDAFNLLFGQAPGAITGAFEGVLLGAAVGLGVSLGGQGKGVPRLRRGMMAAGLAGGAAGVLIVLLGGRLMGGSLDQLAGGFAGSRLSLDAIGALFDETGFGPISQAVTGGLEGALFGACVAGAMVLARRGLGEVG